MRLPTEPRPPQISSWQRLRILILRWLISTLAIFVAVLVVPGIDFVGPGWQLGIVALLFGLINLALRPILTVLTCPLIVLSFGLFTLVINAVLLSLTAAIAGSLGVQFTVDNFWAAIGGGIVISVVTLALSMLAGDTSVRVVIRRNDTNQ